MSNSIFYRICTAFEVRVRSQSLCAIDLTDLTESSDSSGATSSGAAASMAPNTTNKLWTTKEANACVLTALLLCLVPA